MCLICFDADLLLPKETARKFLMYLYSDHMHTYDISNIFVVSYKFMHVYHRSYIGGI